MRKDFAPQRLAIDTMETAGDAEALRTEESASNDFAWPPPTSEVVIWQLDAGPIPTGEIAEAPLEATPRATLPIPHVLSGGVAFQWHHALALVQQLAVQLKDGAPSKSLLDLDAIDLEATGRLRTRLDPGTIPIVRSLGHVLHQLLTDHPGPANLRHIALRASSETPTFASVDDLMQALGRHERHDRLKVLATLYERAREVRWPVSELPPSVEPVEPHDETNGYVAALPPPTSHKAAAMWWHRGARRTQILGVVAGTVCIALAGIAVVVHQSGQSASAPLAASGEPPTSDQHTTPPNVTRPNVTRPNVTEQGRERLSRSPVSRAAGATNSVARAQRPKPQREGTRVAVRQPASTRIPRIAEEEFGRARELFDRKKYAAAADGFQRVITILSDGELTPSASTLRSMATEMVFVSRAALASAPGPQAHMAGDASVIEPVPLQQSLPAPPAPDLSPDPRVYAAGDAGVIEPVPLKQYIPPHPAPDVSPSDLSVLELLIDSRGAVEWVHLRNPKNRYRDAWWLSAAKAWRFRPALKDGQPVKFLERILITTFTPSDPQ